jgi:hypothetical protein
MAMSGKKCGDDIVSPSLQWHRYSVGGQRKDVHPFFTTCVKQHGGSIEVDKEPGEFSEIRLILPRAAALLPEQS